MTTATESSTRTPSIALAETTNKPLPLGFLNNQITSDVMLEIFKNLPIKDLLQAHDTCKDWKHLIRSNNLITKEALKRDYTNLEILEPEVWGTKAECEALNIDPTGAPDVDIIELARVVVRLSAKTFNTAGVTIFPMPQNLTINKLIHQIPIFYIDPEILRQIGNTPVSRTYLAVMTTGLLRGNPRLTSEELCKSIGAEMPSLIDILAQSVLKFRVRRELVPLSEPNSTLSAFSISTNKSAINAHPFIGGFNVGNFNRTLGLHAFILERSCASLGVVGLKRFQGTD